MKLHPCVIYCFSRHGIYVCRQPMQRRSIFDCTLINILRSRKSAGRLVSLCVSDFAHTLFIEVWTCTSVRYNWLRPDLYKRSERERERERYDPLCVCCDTYYLHDVIFLPLSTHTIRCGVQYSAVVLRKCVNI